MKKLSRSNKTSENTKSMKMTTAMRRKDVDVLIEWFIKLNND